MSPPDNPSTSKEQKNQPLSHDLKISFDFEILHIVSCIKIMFGFTTKKKNLRDVIFGMPPTP
jgi:hypothetical protein